MLNRSSPLDGYGQRLISGLAMKWFDFGREKGKSELKEMSALDLTASKSKKKNERKQYIAAFIYVRGCGRQSPPLKGKVGGVNPPI